MKKIGLVIVLLFFVMEGFSQNLVDRPDEFPQHEINYNIANTIAIGDVEFGYEYFFDFNQSVGIKFLINDRRNFRVMKKGEKFNTNSIRLNYTYYFSDDNPGSGVYVQPLIKYRFGTFTEHIEDQGAVETNMNAFMIGAGLGYEWNFSNTFIVGPFFNISRSFSQEVKDRFSPIDFNAGLNIGYRF